MTFEIIQRNYERKLWNRQMVQMAVTKGVITPKQAEDILNGEPDPEAPKA